MFGPHGPHLLIGRKFATGGSGFGGRNSGTFVGRERHRRCLIIRAGKPENNAGDVVLSVRRKAGAASSAWSRSFVIV